MTAASVLSGAAAGCATIDVLTNPEAAAKFAPHKAASATGQAGADHAAKKTVEHVDLAARVAALAADLDARSAFDPERRAAEPALIALAARIAAGLGETAVPLEADAMDAPTIDLMPIAALSAPPPVLTPAPPETPWAVEFGQFDDADLAKTMWMDIAAAAPSAARGLVPRVITRADGVVLRAGPFDDRDHAASACATFEAAGVTCSPAKLAGKALIDPALIEPAATDVAAAPTPPVAAAPGPADAAASPGAGGR